MIEISEEINELLSTSNFCGTVCITSSNKIVYEAAFGKAEYAENIPNRKDTTFFIASLTKQFTAIAVMLLSNQGRLKLDDKLDCYLPSYRHAGKISIRNLLNMSSGIVDYLNDIIDSKYHKEEKESLLSEEEFFFYATDGMNRSYSFSEVMQLIEKESLLYNPGEKLNYSNTNYQILGYIIEEITGKSFAEFIEENILIPMHMNNTCFGGSKAEANSYMEFNGVNKVLGRSRSMGADGIIVSNVYDMTKWLRGSLDNKLLSESDWSQCFNVVDNTDKAHELKNYGFGWIKEGEWFVHGGIQLGYLAGVALRPSDQTTVVVLGNKCTDHDTVEPMKAIIGKL